MKITDYPQVKEIQKDEVILIDGPRGTKTITAEDLLLSIVGLTGVTGHTAVYRGYNLGSRITEAQIAAVRDESFTNLFVGDYWLIDNIKWRIVDINYYLTKVPNSDLNTSPHLVIMPDESIWTGPMELTKNTSGSFLDSNMYKVGFPAMLLVAQAALGASNILPLRDVVPTRRDNGSVRTTSWITTQNRIMIPRLEQLFGGNNFSVAGADRSLGKQQFAGFRMNRTLITYGMGVGYTNYWTMDCSSQESYVGVSNSSTMFNYDADVPLIGTRPILLVG